MTTPDIERVRQLRELVEIDHGVAHPDEWFLVQKLRWVLENGRACSENSMVHDIGCVCSDCETWRALCDAAGVSDG